MWTCGELLQRNSEEQQKDLRMQITVYTLLIHVSFPFFLFKSQTFQKVTPTKTKACNPLKIITGAFAVMVVQRFFFLCSFLKKKKLLITKLFCLNWVT